ncbi:MAG: YeiH family protein [Solirubrobacterales bacterium]
MKNTKKIAPGVIICILIAIPAWLLGKNIPVIGAPVFGITLGMILTLLVSKKSGKFEHGIKFTSKKILQYSIILLGFEMNLFNILKVGSQSLYVIIFTLSASFITAFIAGRLLKIPGKTAALVGIGTSICGGSAIAAAAPVLQAEDEDVAHAISTIFLFNIIAVFIFPLLGRFFGMSDMGFGMWAGTAINDTSSVVAAGASWSSAAGNNTALTFATIVKLTRTLMIVPVTLFLAIYTSRKNKDTNTTENFNISKIFPWFVLAFILVSIVNTFSGINTNLSHLFVELGKFMITMAMAAIGLNTNIVKLLKNGFKPILLGLCCWFSVAAVSIIVQLAMNMW